VTAVWLTARGTGLSALVLLTATTVLGALTSGRGRATTRYLTQRVHRALAVTGIAVLAVHVGTILADSYAHVGVTGAVVPFMSGYRATWVGLGTIAAYLLVLTSALGLARGRVAASPAGARLWRPVHALGYLAWAAALYHGLRSGTDSAVAWVRWTYLACAGAGFAAMTWRLLAEMAPRLLVLRRHREVTA
jgi:hypothetical protein